MIPQPARVGNVPERAWKRAERTVARLLGGERTPLSGSNSRHTSADAIEVDEYLEHKRRKSDPVHAQLSQLGERARRRDRWPVIFYDLVGDDGPRARWVAIWLERYVHLKGIGDGEGVYPFERTSPAAPWLVEHEVGKRLPHGRLVLETVEAARAEGREPLVVVTRHRSSKRVALVPVEVQG